MSKKRQPPLKIYVITNRSTREKHISASSNAQDACKLAGWPIDDCSVIEEKPQLRMVKGSNYQMLFHIPCQVCPFLYFECKKPLDEECPTRPNAPELQDWIRQAAEACLCGYTGLELDKKDYYLGQKWVTLRAAIKELAPKP